MPGGIPVGPIKIVHEDVTGDGLLDLSLKFSIPQMVDAGVLGPHSNQLRLTGRTLGGTNFIGTDNIRIVNPEPATWLFVLTAISRFGCVVAVILNSGQVVSTTIAQDAPGIARRVESMFDTSHFSRILSIGSRRFSKPPRQFAVEWRPLTSIRPGRANHKAQHTYRQCHIRCQFGRRDGKICDGAAPVRLV